MIHKRMVWSHKGLQMWAALSLFFLVLCTHAYASDEAPVTLPITLNGAHIYLQATVNDKPVTLVLDSGAGVNVLTPEAAQRLELKPSKNGISVLGAGGAAQSVSSAVIDKLEVGKARLERQPVALIPLPNPSLCDGLLGAPLFQQWVVTIDYAQSRLILTPSKSFTPPAEATAFPLRIQNDLPQIEATADGCKDWFSLDTGAGDTLTLFGPFVEKNRLRGKYAPALQTVTGRGVGGLVYGDVVRLPEFAIGKFRFLQPIASLSRQTQGAFSDREIAGNIGGRLLRRFTVTFDYPHQRLYLTPNALYDKPFIYNRTGLSLDYVKGVFVVRAVLPNSPGAEAGVAVEDTILAIDDVPAEKLKPWEPGELFQRDSGTKVRLKLRSSGNTTREVTLTLRDLL